MIWAVAVTVGVDVVTTMLAGDGDTTTALPTDMNGTLPVMTMLAAVGLTVTLAVVLTVGV